MPVILTRDTTQNPAGTPSQLVFDTWVGVPAPPRNVVSFSRRLGSDKLIRQNLGVEGVETQCQVTKTFPLVINELIGWKGYLQSIYDAQDETTFYTWSTEDTIAAEPFTVERCQIIDVRANQIKIVRGSTGGDFANGTSKRILLDLTLIIKTDGAS